MLRAFWVEITFFVVPVNRASDNMHVAFTVFVGGCIALLFSTRRSRFIPVASLLRFLFLLLPRLLREIVWIGARGEDNRLAIRRPFRIARSLGHIGENERISAGQGQQA